MGQQGRGGVLRSVCFSTASDSESSRAHAQQGWREPGSPKDQQTDGAGLGPCFSWLRHGLKIVYRPPWGPSPAPQLLPEKAQLPPNLWGALI